jgi:membrane-associated phospholipid phosphatase
MRTPFPPATVVLFLGVLVLQGCASAKRDLNAGDYWPSGARWKQATMNALTSRGTWVPLIGAGVVSIDDWDREISDWAVENTPVFGSTEDAIEASDNLKTVTTVAMVGTALAVPNGEGAWEWKPERLLLEFGAVQLNNVLTSGLKSATDRERPDGSDNRSFPSGHSSQAFTRATLACRNVDQIPSLSNGWRVTLKTSFRVIAAGTAWARVEGGKHYPSDVLFGAALGNFVAIFVHDAFLPADSITRFTATLSRKEVSFSVAFAF